MGNTYFQFKQFRIEQSGCAMKVCTDACIFGAWYAQRIKNCNTVLDIGSGTGLLMMMLAQQSDAVIHGIEIEAACYQQLLNNVSAHPWSHRIKAFYGDAREFNFPVKYDFIISNPPFYDNDLSSMNSGRQLAMHSTALRLDELADVISRQLNHAGRAGILLPAHRAEAFDLAAAAFSLVPVERLLVRHTESHPWFRSITTYVKRNEDEAGAAVAKLLPDDRETVSNANEQGTHNPALTVQELTIRNSDGSYTDKFMSLLGDYYL
ncbi:MAG: methyltransferase domain-containing protein [Chitinophagaceae bacterium]|nr:MAG: methyltransferase domain-containing protein [Chitinophagaceae bacterium]